MQTYSTDAGDSIRIETADEERVLSTDLRVTVHTGAHRGRADGVITSAAHGDAIHDLFRREATFRIVVDPADGTDRRTFEECTLLSSSGKWVGRRG